MRIVDFVSNNVPINDKSGLCVLEETLYVQMTQEEYQIACQAILNKKDKEKENEEH